MQRATFILKADQMKVSRNASVRMIRILTSVGIVFLSFISNTESKASSENRHGF